MQQYLMNISVSHERIDLTLDTIGANLLLNSLEIALKRVQETDTHFYGDEEFLEDLTEFLRLSISQKKKLTN